MLRHLRKYRAEFRELLRIAAITGEQASVLERTLREATEECGVRMFIAPTAGL